MKIKLVMLALAAGGIIFVSDASGQPLASETRTLRDWTAVCDNINACVAYAPTGPRFIRERLNGLGGFAINIDSNEIIHWPGYGDEIEDASILTVEKCQQPNYTRGLSMTPPSQPDANCKVLIAWRNACASIAKGLVDGVDYYIGDIGRNARESRAKSLEKCQELATECRIEFDARCVASSVGTRAPYDYEIGYRR